MIIGIVLLIVSLIWMVGAVMELIAGRPAHHELTLMIAFYIAAIVTRQEYK